MTQTEEETLRLFIDAGAQINDTEWNQFSLIWEKATYQRKELISQADATENFLYFILEGAQRVFFTDYDKKEATLVFTYPNSFGGNLDSFLLRSPSKYHYEALTRSTVLRTSYSKLFAFRQSNKTIDNFLQSAIHYALSGLLERMVELQCFSSEEKFRALLQRSPHILQIVPNKYLANYIGVDPSNFSKLINSVRL